MGRYGEARRSNEEFASAPTGEEESSGNMKDAEVRIDENRGVTCALD